MRIFLCDHAIVRSIQRVVSPTLAKQLCSKALYDVKRGKGRVRTYPCQGHPNRTRTVWNGWQFVTAPTKWTDANGTACEGVTLITVYPTVAFHMLKSEA